MSATSVRMCHHQTEVDLYVVTRVLRDSISAEDRNLKHHNRNLVQFSGFFSRKISYSLYDVKSDKTAGRSVETGVWVGKQKNRGSIPVRGKTRHLFLSVETGSVAFPDSCRTYGGRGLFP